MLLFGRFFLLSYWLFNWRCRNYLEKSKILCKQSGVKRIVLENTDLMRKKNWSNFNLDFEIDPNNPSFEVSLMVKLWPIDPQPANLIFFTVKLFWVKKAELDENRRFQRKNCWYPFNIWLILIDLNWVHLSFGVLFCIVLRLHSFSSYVNNQRIVKNFVFVLISNNSNPLWKKNGSTLIVLCEFISVEKTIHV